jgi:hypothetical protein
VGHPQPQKQNTPHTKRVHKSGVSAEVITSSELTAEQTALKNQNKIEGISTEFYNNAVENGSTQSDMFVTENTVYYPNAVFKRNNAPVVHGVASFTRKRFEDLIDSFSVREGGDSTRDYAMAYVAYISPSDFLSLTTVNEQKIIDDTKTNEKYGGGKLDIERLSNYRQTPYLKIDFEKGVVTAHEGRHRMVMLRNAGIEKVAIVIQNKNPESGKFHTEKMRGVTVTGQKFDAGTATGAVTFQEIIPLSPNYRDEVTKKFITNTSDIRYSEKDGGGYDGNRMSNRAVRAYENGEKPISKWTKKEIIESIVDYAWDNNIDIESIDLSELTAEELKNTFLRQSSWHHTGALYNATNFYSINEEAVKNLTTDTINNIISKRTRTVRSEEERQAIKSDKAALQEAQNVYRKLEVIFASGITGLKTIKSVYSRYANGRMDLDSTYADAVKAITDKDASKVEGWKALPEDHWRHKTVELYENDIDSYIDTVYRIGQTASNPIIQELKADMQTRNEPGILLSGKDKYEGQPLYSLKDTGVPDLFESFDMAEKPKTLYPRGSTGFGVKLLNQFLRNIEKK